ncbi:MAG: single-stranded-DNA-specific exonuclease RecJ [Chlamydiales bacterium]
MFHPNEDDLIWVYPNLDPEWKATIIKEFKVHPITAQVLVARGFNSLETIHDYLYAKLPDLHDPFLFNEMKPAVERLTQVWMHRERVLIYGDNDVDGMTGTALLTDFLRSINVDVLPFVSHSSGSRQTMFLDALEYAIEKKCKLVITVDCGITATQELAEFTENGIDVIITDHHEPAEVLPKVTAILNPKLLNNTYPNRHLTGVGVAFKLAHALLNHLVAEGKISSKKVDLKNLLDLVAMGTISDMGALQGENRILVRYGIKQLRKTKRIGLAKLVSICDMELSDLNTFTIASKIAPRLNSLGRIADPQKGVQLLLIRNVMAAEKLAIELDLNNIERQKIERTVSIDVENFMSTNPSILKNKAIVISSDKWHPGVIAILSTRISKQFNRPTVMIAIENEIGKGSVRSIPEFPLLTALKQCSDLLINFGGHDFAAGLTIKEQNIPAFVERFIHIANQTLKDQDVVSKLYLDSEIYFEDLTFDCMESIRLLEPYGNENPPPVLYCDAKQAWPPKVVGKTHLKLYLEQDERLLEGVAFGQAESSTKLRKKNLTLRVAFTPQVSNYQKKPSIKLIVRGFKILPPSSNLLPFGS